MDADRAAEMIARAVDSAETARAYLLCGGAEYCLGIEDSVAKTLFPDTAELAESGTHPDIIRLSPSGKRREITVDAVRDEIVGPMSSSSFCGGWRMVVVDGADRLNPQAANALLKSLEEPPPKSLFLLETDAPDSILPTILSRVQRIDLPAGDNILDGDAYAAVAETMNSRPGANYADKMRTGRALAAVLEEVSGDEDAPADAEKRFFLTIMKFVREWMAAGKVERFKSFRNVEAVEAAARQCARSMNKEAVLCRMADRISFP